MSTISRASRAFAKARDVLAERLFSEQQIAKLLPRLHEKMLEEPKYLAEIIDKWNTLMGSAASSDQQLMSLKSTTVHCPPEAKPPKNCPLWGKIGMNNILAEIEPDLLLLDPEKLFDRQNRLRNLALTNSLSEEWLLLFNAPRGIYLQDWVELMKKIYYIEERVVGFLYDKKERKAMPMHPLVKSAAITETDFDHIRARYLFALRSGFKSMSYLYGVQVANTKPSLTDLILADNESYLKKFAKYCSIEEYNSFSNLMKNHDLDEDDAEIFEQLAELDNLRSSSDNKKADLRET